MFDLFRILSLFSSNHFPFLDLIQSLSNERVLISLISSSSFLIFSTSH